MKHVLAVTYAKIGQKVTFYFCNGFRTVMLSIKLYKFECKAIILNVCLFVKNGYNVTFPVAIQDRRVIFCYILLAMSSATITTKHIKTNLTFIVTATLK